MREEIFESSVRSDGNYGGVVEEDEGTIYFYLYSIDEINGNSVIDTLHIYSGISEDFQENLGILWNKTENMVGLTIGGVLWAAFDIQNSIKYGGNYSETGRPAVPVNLDQFKDWNLVN